MAFNTAEGRAEYTASSAQTGFTFTFKIYTTSDIKVYQTPSGVVPNDTTDLLTLTTDYTVSINGDNGGTVTLNTGAVAGDTIVLVRSLPATRTIDYQDNGDLLAATLDTDQNYQTYLILDGYTQLSRTLMINESLTGVSLDVPSPLADSYIKWNSTATALQNDTTIPTNVTLSQTAATTATTQAGIATTQAGLSATSATNSQLRAWESEAERLTADSYATEAEDVVVKVYSSNGNGTFTATPTTEYSALHWSNKATVNANFAPSVHASTSKTTPVDADEFPLLDSSASFGLKKITWANVLAGIAGAFVDLTTNQTISGIKSFVSNILTPNVAYKPTPVTITSWSYVTTTITLNVASHSFVANDYIEVGGLTATTNIPNGVHLVTSVTATTIVFTYALTPTGTAGVSSATVKGYTTINGRANGIGEGQTWQNVTASRTFSTTYTNTTGKPIEVIVTTNGTSGTAQNGHHFLVNGNIICGSTNAYQGGIGDLNYTTSVIVPSQATYSINKGANTTTIAFWSELR